MFDFASYLYTLTGEHWSIHELSGGNANFVVRATPIFEPRVNLDGSTPEKDLLRAHGSVVLKQAPPYFAKFPEVAFSQRRQNVEATALAYFESQEPLRDVLHAHPSIQVPSLLHHDRSQHVIIQSDVGTYPTLDIFLSSPTTTEANASTAGHALGSFLAGLHHAYDDPSSQPDLLRVFSNEDAEHVMQGVIKSAMKYMEDAGVGDWDVLGSKALSHWKDRRKTAFSQGDIWFGTILVDGEAAHDAPMLKICDWEFAGLNERAADIAQLGAYLHLTSLSSLTSPHMHRTLEAFSASLYKAYFSTHSHEDDPRFHHSWLVMHGWELVNAAAWRHELWCACPATGVKCEHIAEMVREGAAVLRAALDEDEGSGTLGGKLWEIPWFASLARESGKVLGHL